ncbi:MAG: FAD-dependent oxidoreductase, partial [Halobacteriovoraceae bacterium]|nr:FAD-dependent oxidoreductase [Halobacteriovoraceae bacterium]
MGGGSSIMNFYEKSLLKNIPSHTPVLIVGGGIAGAGVFRDLSLHNVPCVLIDKKDFTSQTSQSSSKMLHGGIRYLENMDFALVWEALHEKNLWLKLTPHLAYPEHFFLPVYKDSLRPLWMVRIGLFLYDLLSSFKNIPHKIASKDETLENFPFLKKEGLTGSGVYSDGVMDDAKMTLECIYDGMVSKDSYACNHVSFINATELNKGYQVELKDENTGETKTIRTDHIVFTTGPFTDKVLSKLNLFPWSPKLS